ncbi:unnamed protein product [Chironomus riparius]|uniref:Aminopeptidase n=1 Tax=Chironomus riparius TaxID=315576 RepID=A0A9N9RXU7_9DIPT|nr:unnamed protein product [Chironomus riparius]
MDLLEVIIIFLGISLVHGNPLNSDASKFLLEEPKTYRLPNDSIPVNYEIIITTNVHTGELNFTGNVKIRLKIMEPTNKITLHSRQIDILKIDIWSGSTPFPIRTNAPINFIESHDFLVVDLPNIYDPYTELILVINYNGKIRDDGTGFYYGTYTDDEGVTKYYGATQFEIIDARYAFPCYDEPGIRAEMTLTIIHDKSLTAISNTDVAIQVEDETGNYWVTTFATTPKMQTYLLAFVISDFEYVNHIGSSRIPQKIYGPPNMVKNGQISYAAVYVGPILKSLETVLGIEMPLIKMDHVGLSKFNYEGMENFGLINYCEKCLMIPENMTKSEAYKKQNYILNLISHEYAHQWFGNLVSPKWWQYVWLNEGMATLFENYIPHQLEPDRRLMRNFFTKTMPTAFRNDEMGSWAMNLYKEHPNDLQGKFGGIGYQKSACVLRMFMEVMTENVFLNGLNRYLIKNKFNAATPRELHIGLQEAYNSSFPGNTLNIGEVMYTWENQPGYPLISVSLSGKSLIFSQRRYPESDDEIYSVPITLATATNPDFSDRTPKIWLHSEAMQVSRSTLSYSSNDWIVVNINQVGYYRVDYDTTLWRANIEQLNDNHEVINPLNRALLQDEFYLAWTEFDRVEGVDGLGIISYFDKETEYLAWERAQKTLNGLNEHLFGTEVYEKFLEMIEGLTKTHLINLTFESTDGESLEDEFLRFYTKKWNCLANDGDCLVAEYQKLDAYYKGAGPVNFNFCYALRLAGDDIYPEIFNKVINDRNFEERLNYLKHLGCSIYPDNLNKIFEAVLDTQNILTNDEREFMLYGIYNNSKLGLEMTLDFINENYLTLNSLIDLYETMYNIAGYVNSNSTIPYFLQFVNKLESEQLITNDNSDTISSRIASNKKWNDKNYAEILIFFRTEDTTTAISTEPSIGTESTTTESISSPISTEPFTESKSTTTESISSPISTEPQSSSSSTKSDSTTTQSTLSSTHSTTKSESTTSVSRTTSQSITSTNSVTQPSTTAESTGKVEDSTTTSTQRPTEPSTTPGNGNTAFKSISLVLFCALLSLLKLL